MCNFFCFVVSNSLWRHRKYNRHLISFLPSFFQPTSFVSHKYAIKYPFLFACSEVCHNNNNNNKKKKKKKNKSIALKFFHPLHYLLTYSMVQSPSWEANWFTANQEIPRISRNPKVHYRTHRRPPPVSILDQPKPVHIPTSHFLEIHPNIIHPSTPRSPQWSPFLRFPQQEPIHPPLLTHTRHMPSPSHSSRFYHPHNIGWGVQII